MAKTINSAQAAAVADGFLDSLGTDRSNADIKITASLRALIELAAMIIENAQRNLNAGGHISSGRLSDSLEVSDPKMLRSVIELDVLAADYYRFVNSGVKGTKSGNSKAGFAFKYDNPSAKMVKAIADWLETSHKVTTFLLKRHAISKTEHKNATLSDYDSAYGIAKGIVKKGIKATGFFDKAIALAQQYAQEKLGKALRVDVINSLPDNLNDNGNNNKK